ncbi:Uncharacterised protein [Candidatus Norongarragalina meridionalis]|nr:Uncharacterised protein [Candidatus Norongarragalina meridionalis]
MKLGYLAFGLIFAMMAGLASAAVPTYDINVSLAGPVTNNWNATATALNFTYTVIYNAAGTLANCTLYTNASGTWAQSASNASAVGNGSIAGIAYTVPTNGTIIWNINCTSLNGTYMNYSGNGSASAGPYTNYTVNIDTSKPVITITSPANNTIANKTTTYGAEIGNMTFAILVTGLGTGSTVNCSVALNATTNHTNSSLTANGTTRIEYLQIPENSTSRLNVSCQTRAATSSVATNSTNDTMYYGGIYYNPLVKVTTPNGNKSWVSDTHTLVNFSVNHTIVASYNATSRLNCSLYLNTTWNVTNPSVFEAITNQTFILSTDSAYSAYWDLNITCKDVAGNIGYNDSIMLGLDSAVNYTNDTIGTNSSGKTSEWVAFSAYFTDARNLSGYIFSTNGTSGAWANDSWVPLYDAAADVVFANYSNVTKQISGTLGNTVGWVVYVNDSLGNWNYTGIRQFWLTSASTGGGGTVLPTSTPAPTPVPTVAQSTPAPTTLEIPTATPAASETPTATPLPPVSGMTSSDAESEIASAQGAISSPAAGADIAAAQQELTLATQFMDEGDYDSAVQHAREAARLATTAMPTATITPSYVAPTAAATGGTNWLLYAVVILVLAGAGYYFFAKPKKGL